MEENTQKTPEELMAEIERLNAENAKLKQATTNASADASKYKKEAADVRERLNSKLTEQEKAEAERADRDAKREARIAELEKKERLSSYTARLMDCGYDNVTAADMATYLPESVSDDYFTKQKAFREAEITRIKAEALKAQPSLTVGATPSAKEIEDSEMEKLRRYAGLR